MDLSVDEIRALLGAVNRQIAALKKPIDAKEFQRLDVSRTALMRNLKAAEKAQKAAETARVKAIDAAHAKEATKRRAAADAKAKAKIAQIAEEAKGRDLGPPRVRAETPEEDGEDDGYRMALMPAEPFRPSALPPVRAPPRPASPSSSEEEEEDEEEFRLAPISPTSLSSDEEFVAASEASVGRLQKELAIFEKELLRKDLPPDVLKETEEYVSGLKAEIAKRSKPPKPASRAVRILEEFNSTHEYTPAAAVLASTRAARAAARPQTRRLLGKIAGLTKDVHPRYLPGRV